MKNKRQLKILEIIEKNDVETQEELAALLKSSGYEVTQATVSRDIKELGLIKVPAQNFSSKYALSAPQQPAGISERLENIFVQSVRHIDYANNMIVLKTISGMAQAAGYVLDEMNLPQVLGTIAGDDTVMIVAKSGESARQLCADFRRLIQQEA